MEKILPEQMLEKMWCGVSWVRIPLGAFVFSSICSVYIDRHIRVDLADHEKKCSKYAMLYTVCRVYKIWSDELSSRRSK